MPALTAIATSAASAVSTQVDALTATDASQTPASPSAAEPPGQVMPRAHPLRARRAGQLARLSQASQSDGAAQPFGETGQSGAPRSSGVATSPDRALTLSGAPASNFARVASGLLRCTLRRDRPLAERYIFFGETPPGKGTALFSIHQRTAEGRHGRRVYKGEFIASAGGTVLNVANVALPVPLANRISNDIERWSSTSDTSCAPQAQRAEAPAE